MAEVYGLINPPSASSLPQLRKCGHPGRFAGVGGIAAVRRRPDRVHHRLPGLPALCRDLGAPQVSGSRRRIFVN